MTLGSPPPSGDPANSAPDADAGLSHNSTPSSDETGASVEETSTVSENEDAQSAESTQVEPAPESIRSDVPVTHLPVAEIHAGSETEPLEYEDDETPGTLFLRAVFTLLAGGFLLWGQWSSGVNAAEQWGTWVKGAALANFVLPLGIVWLFFGQGLRTPEWMRDERHNAWAYGWNPRPFLKHMGFALLCLIVMLPFLWYYSRNPEVRANYQQNYLPPTQTPESLVRVLIGLTIYMLCWEWFFRGFLLFGMAQGLRKWGWIPAIFLQAALFYGAHFGKGGAEVQSSFFGGLLLGLVCWRWKSFFPAFYTHLLIHVAWVLLIR